MLIENFPFFLRTQQLGSQKEREQSLQNSENSMFLGSQTKKSYQSLQNSVVSIAWVRKKNRTNRNKKSYQSLGKVPHQDLEHEQWNAHKIHQRFQNAISFQTNQISRFLFAACMVNHMWAHPQLS